MTKSQLVMVFPPPKSKSYQSHAVTVDTATSHPPGHKTLGPNSSSLHTLCRDDYSKSSTSEPSDHKVGSQANQSQPKVKLSDIPVKYDITHSHDLPVSHSDKCPLPVCSIFPQSLQLPPLLISQLRTPCTHLNPLWVKLIMRTLPLVASMACVMKKFIMFLFRIPHTSIYPLWVNFIAYIAMLAPMIRIVWLRRTLPVTTFGKELIELEYPRLRVLFRPLLKLHTSLNPRMVIMKIPSPYILMTVLMTLNFRIPYMSSYSLLALRIMFSELVTVIPVKCHHMMMTVPNLSDLFDDNLSSPTDQFQDVIELGQCNIFDSAVAKDFALTFGECNIFDDSSSDDNYIDLLLAKCNIFTERAPGPSNTENDISQHDDSVPQLGKHVPFPTEDTPTLSETLIPPESGYHSLIDANIVAPALPMNHIFPQPSVACESFSKHFAVNITSCGDADSSTLVPGIHIPLGCESDVSTVSLALAEASLQASTPKVPGEGQPSAKVWESTPSPKAHITSSHDDILGIDPGMGLPHVDLSHIPIPIDIITESPDEVLAPKQTSSLGCPKLVDARFGGQCPPYINYYR